MSPITQQLQGESWGEIRTCSTHQTQLICAEEVEEIWLHSIPSWLSGIPRMHAHMKGARVRGGAGGVRQDHVMDLETTAQLLIPLKINAKFLCFLLQLQL